MTDVVDELDQTIREIRQAIFRLTVHNLDAASVRRRVVDVVDDEEPALGFAPELAFSGPLETLSDEVVDHLLATLREALSNVARHAEARSVRVGVEVTDEALCLVVDDDGVGIPVHPHVGARPGQHGGPGHGAGWHRGPRASPPRGTG